MLSVHKTKGTGTGRQFVLTAQTKTMEKDWHWMSISAIFGFQQPSSHFRYIWSSLALGSPQNNIKEYKLALFYFGGGGAGGSKRKSVLDPPKAQGDPELQ